MTFPLYSYYNIQCTEGYAILLSVRAFHRDEVHASLSYPFFLCLDLLLVEPAGGVSSTSSLSVSCSSSAAAPSSSAVAVAELGEVGDAMPSALALRAICSIFCASPSTPFQAPQALHFHRPISSTVLAPGGDWPLTSRQLSQISAIRFFGCLSSSPRTTSSIRSYHFGPSDAYCEICRCGGGGTEKAFGAKSSLGAASLGGGRPRWLLRSADVGREPGCGGGAGCRLGIFAVGGGAIPVRCCGVPGLPCAAMDLRLPVACGDDLALGGDPPYFSSSCCVLLYFVAVFSFSMAASRCFCRSLRWACEPAMR